MKKLLVSVLAIAGLVACSQDTTLVQNSNNGTLMEFNVAALDNATRVDPSITVNTLNGFDVWAYVDSKGGTVLTEERVSLVNDAWSYVNKQYWSPEHDYFFTAIAPVDTNNWEYDQANDTIAFTNVDGTEDLLLATKTVSTHNTEIGQSMPAVGLQFNHLLSKVRFTFKNNFTTDNVFVEVEGVEFEVPATGTYSTVDGTWANLGGDATLEFGNVAMLGMGQSGTASDTEGVKNDRFVIPTSDQCKVSFTIKHYNGNVLVGKYEKESTITGVTFEKGKAYNFVAAFDSTNVADTALTSIEFTVEGVDEWVEVVEANDAADIQQIINAAEGEVEIVLSNDIDLNEVATRAAGNATIVVPAGKVVTIDLNGKTLYATEAATKNYELIKNQGTLTVKNGNMWVKAENNREWNAYSAVIANTVGGNLTVDGVNIEHKGGTDMAYGIDNLTNGKGTYAVTTIKNSTVKSPYRAVRQFLNGVEATNELYVKAGAVLEGANKSIFFHDPSKNANTGKLVVEAGAQLMGDVYLFVTAGSTEWPVEVSIASSALVGGSQVLSGNVPAGYFVVEKDGNYIVDKGLVINDKEYVVLSANGLVALAEQGLKAGDKVLLGANIDLTGVEFNGLDTFHPENNNIFDGQGYTVSNWTNNSGASDMGFIRNWVGTVKNVKFENCHLKTSGRSAIAAAKVYGNIENVTINNCSLEDSYWACGLVAGLYNAGNISGCTVTNSSIKSNGGTGAIVGVINESAGTRKVENCKVEDCTVNNTGVYGEIYSGALICGMINISDSTVEFNGCSFANNSKEGKYVGDLYYSADEDVTVTIDGKSVVKISTVEELNALKATNAYVMLCADLDFQGAAMAKPIELWKDSTFDGMGHKISNVTTAVQGGYATSLFRGDANPGNKVVKNLVVENLTTPAGYDFAAAIWSDLQGANIEIDNVHVNNAAIASKGTIGGFVGFVSASTTSVVVKNSTINNSNLNGGEADHKRGAVVGRAYGCVVNCENVVVENVKINDVAATETTLVGDKGYTGTVTVK